VKSEVLAETLAVGYIVVLPTQHGDIPIRITLVRPRSNGIKFHGTGLSSYYPASYGWGSDYDQYVMRLDGSGTSSQE
jgi:hypothetical protein